MKNLIRITFVLTLFSIQFSFGQSRIVGKLDVDGIAHMNITTDDAKSILSNSANARSSEQIQINDISFTQTMKGQFCLTGYEKNNQGRIVRGFRIACYQDDANNLIVKPENFSERISGNAFPQTATVSQ